MQVGCASLWSDEGDCTTRCLELGFKEHSSKCLAAHLLQERDCLPAFWP